MKNLATKINLSNTKDNSKAVQVTRRCCTNIYSLLTMYCFDNNIDITSNSDFDSAVSVIEDFDSNNPNSEYYYFWID